MKIQVSIPRSFFNQYLEGSGIMQGDDKTMAARHLADLISGSKAFSRVSGALTFTADTDDEKDAAAIKLLRDEAVSVGRNPHIYGYDTPRLPSTARKLADTLPSL